MRGGVLLDAVTGRPAGSTCGRELPPSVREHLAHAGLLRFLGLPQPEMVDAHANFAYSTVATAPSPASSGTSLVVAAGDGAKFPAAPFNATVWPASAQPTTANAEIVRVTAISTDTLTITRAQESSSARTVVVGDQIAATVTAKTLTDVENATPLAIKLSYGILPDGALAQTWDRVIAASSAFALTSGTLRLQGINLMSGVTITSITFASGSQGVATGTHQLFGIYDDDLGSSSGTARALLRGTSDDTSTAWAANTAKTLNLTSTYTTTRSGVFYLAVLVAATTAPSLVALGVGNATVIALGSITGGNTTNTGITALPNPAAAPTAAAAIYGYVS